MLYSITVISQSVKLQPPQEATQSSYDENIKLNFFDKKTKLLRYLTLSILD